MMKMVVFAGVALCLVVVAYSHFQNAPETLTFEDMNVDVTVLDGELLFKFYEANDYEIKLVDAGGNILTTVSMDVTEETTMLPPYEFSLVTLDGWQLKGATIRISCGSACESEVLP